MVDREMEMGIGDHGGTRRGCEMRDGDRGGNVGWSMKCGEVGEGYEVEMRGVGRGVGLYWRGMDREGSCSGEGGDEVWEVRDGK